jgi:L-2,4-diaminobutyrate transaminase
MPSLQLDVRAELQMNASAQRNRDLADLDRKAMLHPFTSVAEHQRTGPWVIESGDGVWITDAAGNRHIDGMSGLACVNVGYGRPEIAQALYDQAVSLPYFHAFWSASNEPAIRLASRLIDIAPGKMGKVLFGTSGSDANETQIKISWYYNNVLGRPRKKKIIARERSYHGTTIATGSLTGLGGVHTNFDLPIPQVRHIAAGDYSRRTDPNISEEEFSRLMAFELAKLVEREGPDTIAAFIAEPVAGSSGGVLVPPAGYWAEITRVLRKHDILLIADEAVTGLGRTGAMFASDHFGLKPDLLTLSKGLTSGYVPMSASLISERIMRVLEAGSVQFGAFGHGYTNTAHPVCAAAALANLRIIEREGLVEKAATTGTYMLERLHEIFGSNPLVRDIRGIGLLIGVEFVEAGAGDFADPQVSLPMQILRECYEQGLIIRATPGNPTVTLAPPLIITRQEIDLLLERFLIAVDKVSSGHSETGRRETSVPRGQDGKPYPVDLARSTVTHEGLVVAEPYDPYKGACRFQDGENLQF